MKAVLWSVILALGVSSGVRAQSRSWEIGALAGGGPSIVTASLGGVPDGQLLITSVSVTRSFIHWKRFSASYFGEVLPLVVATKIPKAEKLRFGTSFVLFPDGDGPDVGAGVAPVGLRLALNLGRGMLALAEGNGGVVAFARAMPEPGARSLNFLGSAGAGLRLGQRGHRSYVVGYRFTHVSNANTALENPGFNAHVFYLGLTLH